MCNFLSVLVVKGEPCCVLHKPGEDSHEALIAHFKVRERSSASAQDQPFARVEFTPDWAKDVTKPDAWTFKVDEVRRPDWFDADVEARVLRELWSIVMGMTVTKGTHERDGDVIAVGTAKVTIKSGRAWAYDSSTVKACDSSTVAACDSSTVTACGSSTVTAYDSSTVKACDSSTVAACDSSTVAAYDSSTVKACDSSTVTACGSSTVAAYDSSTVKAYDSSTVKAYDSSTVRVESAYADVHGRLPYDGKGFRPVRCDIKVGKAYGVRGGVLVLVEVSK